MELVETITSDGVPLHGALYPFDSPTSAHPSLDALLLVHGTGSNFYASSLSQGLIPRLKDTGLAILAVNTRGHDFICSSRTAEGPRRWGASYELVDECRQDLKAWVDLLVKRGHERVAIVGHSLGAVKAIYSQALEPHSAVRAVAALSPPRLAHSVFAQSVRGAGFLEEYERARAELAAGRSETLLEVRFPLPQVITASSYLDKYGPEERYNVLNFIDRVACPLLVTYGTSELTGMAFAGMPEALEQKSTTMPNLSLAILAGADHVYTGAYAELASRLTRWFGGLAS